MKEKIYGLIGRTLGHSYSEMIHHHLGCMSYKLIELEPEALTDFLTTNEVGGLNVTIPYKKSVIPLCGTLSEAAEETGSVNTLVSCDNGNLYGHNTDIDGFNYMVKRAGIELGGRKVLVLGSGGVSATAVYCAHKQNASEVTIISRSGDDNYNNLDRHFDAQIIINATPVGMNPDQDGKIIDLTPFSRCEGVIDLIYNPLRTNLLIKASELGIRNTGGLPMLVRQAIDAEELFFRRSIPESETEKLINLVRGDTENIVLIGMPGCGKTTIASMISKMTGRRVIDTDAEIEIMTGRKIPDIITHDGEQAFRQIESEVAAKAAKSVGAVIATGGGIVKMQENYMPLHRNGRVYHIEREISLLPKKDRPLSENSDITKMYSERAPLYKRFRDVVVQNNADPEAAAQRIWRDFCENTCY